jgi:hypothetical protein
VATARSVLERLAVGDEAGAWKAAQELAELVLDDPKVRLATAVQEGGPFALRRAVDLAEALLALFPETRALGIR